MGSLVDPSYELVDPTPDVHALFCDFDRRFFDGRLAACEVKWSPRMTTCAGLCCYEVRSGLCQIKLSTPLLKLRPRSDLVETLLHEMIHAFLFVSVRDRDRDGHGPQFQWHMHRINKEAGTRITIYHSFHAEVAVYKQHHWRCSGPCRERRPYFGWVKRTTNRAPSKNDLWWAEHERSCGGTYTKVAEPKEFTEKREKAERKKAEGGGFAKRGGASAKVGGVAKSPVAVDDPKKQPRIDAVFGGGGGGGKRLETAAGAATKPVTVGVVGGGGGQMLGGVAGRSRLLDLMDGGGPGGKTSGTVGKENLSIVAAIIDDDDDDCVLIEPMPRASTTLVRNRPRLRGGSQEDVNLEDSDNSRDGSDRAVAGDDDEFHEELQFDNSDSHDGNSMPHAVPYLGEVGEVLGGVGEMDAEKMATMERAMGEMENYFNMGDDGGRDEHNYGFINTSMPVLSPVLAQNQSQFDAEIARLEKEVAKANLLLNELMDENRCDEVMDQYQKIEGMNAELTSLNGQRDMEMAQRLQDELDANNEISPDEALARQLQKEEHAAEKKSQAIVGEIFAKHSGERGSMTVVPQEKVDQREAENRRKAEWRRKKCEEAQRRTEEEKEERLQREREEWEREEKERYPSRMNEPMITPSPEPIDDERMATGGGEGRGEGNEGEERTDEVRMMRRRGARGRRRERVRRDTVDGEEEQMTTRQEQAQMQNEMVMEEVMMQRRHGQTYDMDIDQWMLLSSLPHEDELPVYEDVGTLTIPTRAAPPAARGNQSMRQRAAPAATAARAAPRLRAPPAAPVQAVPPAAATESAEELRQQLLRLLARRKRGAGTRGGKQPTKKLPRDVKGGEADDEMVDAATIAAMAAEVDDGNMCGAEDEMAASLRIAAAAAAAAAALNRGQHELAMEGVEEVAEPSGDQSHDHSNDDLQSPMK